MKLISVPWRKLKKRETLQRTERTMFETGRKFIWMSEDASTKRMKSSEERPRDQTKITGDVSWLREYEMKLQIAAALSKASFNEHRLIGHALSTSSFGKESSLPGIAHWSLINKSRLNRLVR